MTELRRLDGEDDVSLLNRICSYKDEIGTWDEIARILNDITGNNFGESTYRKRYKALCCCQNISDANELRLERKKLETEKLEYNKWLREHSRDELIMEKIADAIAKLKPLEIPELITPTPSNNSYLLAFADCHYGVEYSITGLYGEKINEYSPEIFETRMAVLLGKVIDIINREGIKELEVWELGDSVEGLLRANSQLMKLRYGAIDSAINYANYLANWLAVLSRYVRVKFQMVVDSNHSQLRLLGQPKNAFPEENLSKVIAEIIRLRTQDNPNITIINNPTGHNHSVIAASSVLGIHGEVKNLASALSEYSHMYGTPIDYIIGAHVHHSKSEEVGIRKEAISIRSIIGTNDFSASIRRSADPGASLLCFNTVDGLTCEYKIKL